LILAAVRKGQSDDQRYCANLSDLYVRYVGRSEGSTHTEMTPDVDASVALVKCKEGDAGAAIPILEQKLNDAGFSLPPRS
jgi:hypothetical protein